jgi:hypothetical protein
MWGGIILNAPDILLRPTSACPYEDVMLVMQKIYFYLSKGSYSQENIRQLFVHL